jgi:hypothetical protein
MLPWEVLCGAAGIGLVAGVLIGAVGVGGIIIVPTLIELPGISVQTAIAVRDVRTERLRMYTHTAACTGAHVQTDHT